jgi:hypothetical protein
MPVLIKFLPGGKVEMTARGYGGTLCQDATAPYEGVLRADGRAVKTTPTAEAAQPEAAAALPAGQRQRLGG